jgi:hypothetical protein
MKPMLLPTVEETLRCIRDSLQEAIAPALTTQTLRSSMASTIHLLHYIERRVEDEGQMRYDEIEKLRGVVAEILAFADNHREGAKLAAAIRQTLGAKRDPGVYPSLKLLAEDVGQMRQHVCDALLLVQSASGADSDKLRETLHGYAVWQLVQEEKLMTAAFRGRGPRR